jgi:hypothetical protein
LLFSVFSFLWNLAFLFHFGGFVLALACATWFFEPKSEGIIGSQGLIRRVVNGLYISVRYHIGTVAFGSFIVALVQTARIVVRVITHYQQRAMGSDPNCVTRAILYSAECCLACFQRLLEFIANQAYIHVAIYGTPFCTSAWSAFNLVLRNVLRFGTAAIVRYLAEVISTVFITALTAVLGYVIVSSMHENISPVIPAFSYIVLGWVVAKIYLDVLSRALDTILHCYVITEEMGNKDAVSGEIKNLLGIAQE